MRTDHLIVCVCELQWYQPDSRILGSSDCIHFRVARVLMHPIFHALVHRCLKLVRWALVVYLGTQQLTRHRRLIEGRHFCLDKLVLHT